MKINHLYNLLIAICCILFTNCSSNKDTRTPAERYSDLQKELAYGWNTWDTHSVLNHVLLPESFGIGLSLIDAEGERIDKCQIGDRKEGAPKLFPGQHSYDGSYTEISVEWNGHSIKVESAADGLNNIILISPQKNNKKGLEIAVRPHNLWGKHNLIAIDGNRFSMQAEDSAKQLNGKVVCDRYVTEGDEIIAGTDRPVLIYCGKAYTIEQAEKELKKQAEGLKSFKKRIAREEYDCFDAMQSVLSWDNIYSPELGKVLSPVSRIWNTQRGGYVLFCWDTYFASMMLAEGHKELAYANLVEITNTITPQGFIPNRTQGRSRKNTFDHSQPPVGAMAAWYIYKKYNEKWIIRLVYDRLLKWNRWWKENRDWDGLLCWGSNPYPGNHKEWYKPCTKVPAILESGLDNSHMYIEADFDTTRCLMTLQDVGLTSMYVNDCECLKNIAQELGYEKDAEELAERAEYYRKNLQITWDEKDGMFYNRDPRNGSFNKRYSPTNLYILLAEAATPQQARRLMKEHLFNPERLGGPWLLPATPRNDPAFKDNSYWRGRIWAPMNFLVYMGMKKYGILENERKELVANSKKLLLKSWLSDGYIFENYNATTGAGDDVFLSDKFYHWGALLGFISLLENGL